MGEVCERCVRGCDGHPFYVMMFHLLGLHHVGTRNTLEAGPVYLLKVRG